MSKDNWPDRETLSRYLLGDVSEEERKSLEEHLQSSENWVAIADSISAEDSLTVALQAGRQLESDDPLLSEIIEWGKQLGAEADTVQSDVTVAVDRRDNAQQPKQQDSANTEIIDDEINFLAPAEEPDEIGRLGDYRIFEVLGVGGMGIVFRGEDTKLQRQVAIKAMKPSIAADASSKDRFLQEARITASIEHHNIVPIYQVGEDRGVPFIAMQFLRGESLQTRIDRTKPLMQEVVLQIGREVATGLAAAHEQHLIHRDIKPDNIWIDEATGWAKILDFGLARVNKEDSGITHSGLIVGTPRYMSPEQAQGHEIDERCDLFSLGSVLYHLITGKLAFSGENLTGTLLAVVSEAPSPIEELYPDVDPDVAALIMKLLAKDRDDRPASAKEVATQIAAIERRLKAEPQTELKAPVDDATVIFEPSATTVFEPTVSHRPPRKKTGSRSALMWSAFGLLILAGIITIATKKGKVTVDIADKMKAGVEVKIKTVNGDKEIAVLDKSNNWTARLYGGDYSIDLNGGNDEFSLKDNTLTVSRFGQNVVKIVYTPVTQVAKDNQRKKAVKFADLKPTPLDGTEKHVSENDGVFTLDGLNSPMNYAGLMVWPNGGSTVDFRIRGKARFVKSRGGSLSFVKHDEDDFTYHAALTEKRFKIWRIGKEGRPDLANEEVSGHLDVWNDLEFLVIADQITASLNGKTVLKAKRTLPAKHGYVGIVAEMCKAEFKDVTVEILDRVKLASMDQTANYALQFDRKDDYVEVDLPENTVDFTKPLTIEAWCTIGSQKTGGVANYDLVQLGPMVAKLWSSGTSEAPQAQAVIGGYRNDQISGVNRYRSFDWKEGETLHVAAQWDGKNLQVYLNGNAAHHPGASWNLGDQSPAEAVKAILLQSEKTQLTVGNGSALEREKSGLDLSFKGKIHSFRASKGLRYKNGDTPPRNLQADGQTIVLYDFSNNQGDVVKDESGNGFHGKIIGAKWVKVDSPSEWTDRTVAEWVLSVGGTINSNYRHGDALPEGPVTVQHLSLPTESFVDGDLGKFANLKSVQSLTLGGGPVADDVSGVSDAGLAHLGQLTGLVSLKFQGPLQLSDEGLSHLSALHNLEQLSFYEFKNSKFTDQGLKELAKLPNLRRLQFVCESDSAPRITGAGFRGFRNLEFLGFISQIPLDEEGVNAIGELKQLQKLSIGVTSIPDSAFAKWKALPRLSSLTINGGNSPKKIKKTTDQATPHIAEMTQLRHLTLVDTEITDIGLEKLYALKELTSLDIRFTKVTPQGVAELHKALPNCKIQWDGGVIEPAKRNHALQFDGKDDWCELPTLPVGDGPCTIEMIVHAGRQTDPYAHIFATNHRGNQFSFGVDAGGGASFGRIVTGKLESTFKKTLLDATAAKPTHVACVWDGKELSLFFDGQLASRGTKGTYPIRFRYALQTSLCTAIVIENGKPTPRYFSKALVDELRVSRTARYRENFEPIKPGERFSTDQETVALYHFDEGQGDVLKDSSGNEHHGKVIGAKWVKSGGSPSVVTVDYAREREVAEWVIKRGGKLRIRDEDLWSYAVVGSNKIPDKKFFVQDVNLAKLDLTDEDIQNLTGLRRLESLVVGESKLTGKGMEAIASLKSLVYLHLDKSNLTDDDLAPLTALPNLQVLKLDFTDLEKRGTQNLHKLKNLRELYFNKLSPRRVAEVAELPRLQVLFIHDVTDAHREAARSVNRHVKIHEYSNEYTDSDAVYIPDANDPFRQTLDEIQKLDGITSFVLSGNVREYLPGSEIPCRHRKIRLIDFAGSKKLTDETIGILDRIGYARDLNLHKTTISDDGLKQIELFDTQKLDLSSTKVTDACVPLLSKRLSLEFLDLSGTKITETGIADIRKSIPWCEIAWDGGVISPE